MSLLTRPQGLDGGSLYWFTWAHALVRVTTGAPAATGAGAGAGAGVGSSTWPCAAVGGLRR